MTTRPVLGSQMGLQKNHSKARVAGQGSEAPGFWAGLFDSARVLGRCPRAQDGEGLAATGIGSLRARGGAGEPGPPAALAVWWACRYVKKTSASEDSSDGDGAQGGRELTARTLRGVSSKQEAPSRLNNNRATRNGQRARSAAQGLDVAPWTRSQL